VLMSLCQRLTDRNSEIIKSQVVKPVEFAREKGVLFDKWCSANDVRNSFGSLRELMLLEDFKNDLPEGMVIFLNEQKVTTLKQRSLPMSLF